MIRLGELLGEREIALGYGVTMTFRPIGYADLKAAEMAALRGARARLSERRDAGSLVADLDPETARRFEDDIAGLAEELLLDEMVDRHASGWTGVAEADGVTAAELTPANWRRFRQGVPYLADALRAELRMPADLVVVEGKPSAA